MSLSIELDPAVRELALAVGVLTRSASGTISLDPDFFSAPWTKVSGILANQTQRAALVAALDLLVETFEPQLIGIHDAATSAAQVRNAYPLLDENSAGQVLLILTRNGQAPGSPLELSIAAEARAANGGPGVTAELTLLTAEGSALTPVAGMADHPLTISVSVPLGNSGDSIAASLAIIAPPDHADSRFTLRLDRADGEPLIIDLAESGAPVGRMAVLLLDLALGQLDPLPDPAARLRSALPGLAGLAETMPEFPFGRIFDDPAALRDWLATLAGLQLPDGSNALAGWLSALATLIGATFRSGSSAAGDPIVLELATGSASTPTLLLEFTILPDPVTGVSTLEIVLALSFAGDPSVDARLAGRAVLLAIPLAGSAPVRALDRLYLLVEATASGNPLVPLTGSGSARFGAGRLEAGIDLAVMSGAPRITPILRLHDVTIGLGGGATHFPVIDFTHFTSVGSATSSVLEDAIEAGIGAGGALAVDALRVLIGLGTTPGTDLAAAVSGPGTAVASYYRTLLAAPAGWSVIATALGHLLGNPATTLATGSGTRADPWAVPVEAAPVPVGSGLAVRIECWNAGTAADPVFTLALQLGAEGPGWDGGLRLGLIDIQLTPATAGQARGLPHAELLLRANTDGPRAQLGDVAVGADAITAAVRWEPGQPLRAEAMLAGIVVETLGETITLGTLDLGALTQPNAALPDLGLGVDPAALWGALRLLLGQSAARLGGDGLAALVAMIGIDTGTPIIEGAAPVPPLSLPASGLPGALRDPLGLLRDWLAALVQQSEAAVRAGGGPAALAVLQHLRAIAIGQFGHAAALPVPGGGSLADPWRIPLLGDDSGAALTLWLGPDGPPKAFAAAAQDRLANPLIDGAGLIAGVEALRGHVDRFGALLSGRDPAVIAAVLDRLDNHVADGDGVLPVIAAAPIGGEWELGNLVDCPHAEAPAHPAAVAQTAARIAALTQGLGTEQWSVVLLAPTFAGARCWDNLVTATGDDPAAIADLSLRVPGIPAHLADMGIVPSARWYRADLGDDGLAPFANRIAAARRVVEAVRLARGGGRVIIVSHSHLGLVAEACASLVPDAVLGLVALAAPLGAAIMRGAAWDDLAEGVRLAQAISPPGASDAAQRAIGWLGQLADGYPLGPDGARVPGLAQAPCWYRQESPPGLAGIPALAIPARLLTRPLAALASGIAGEVAGMTRAAATHLHWGVDLALAVPQAAAEMVQASAALALELGSVALTAAPAAPALPGRINFSARVWREGAWLIGGPALAATASARLRQATFRVDIVPAASGGAATAVGVRLDDGGLRGDQTALGGLSEPISAELLGQTIATLAAVAATAPGVGVLFDLLEDLGFVRPGGAGEPAILLADAVAAAEADAGAWFAARVPALLDRAEGVLGFARSAGDLPGGGPWRFVLPGAPLECRIEPGPWRVSLAVSAAGLKLADAVDLGGMVTLDVGTLTHGRDWVAGAAGARVERARSGGLVLEADWLAEPLVLTPPDPDAIAAALAQAVPRFIADMTIRAVAEQALGAGLVLPSLHVLLADPGRWLARDWVDPATALPDADRIAALLGDLAELFALESDAVHALRVPGLLGVSVALQGSALVVGVDTLAPVVLWQDGGTDAALSFGFGARIGADGSVEPTGDVALRLPLPPSSGWGGIDIALAASDAGLSLAIVSDSGLALTLLPSFGGLDSLVGAGAQMLLPLALDRLAQALAGRPGTDAALTLAEAMGIYDAAAAAGQGFQARTDEIAALVDALGDGDLQTLAPAIAGALTPLLQSVLGNNVTVSANSGAARLTLANVLGGDLSLDVDLATSPPGVRLLAAPLALDPVTLDLEAGLVAGDVLFDVTIGVSITAVPGVVIEPVLAASLAVPAAGGPPRLDVRFAPAGPTGAAFQLSPVPTAPTDAELLALFEDWLLPLAGNIILHVAEPLLARPLWSGGRTIGELAVATALLTRSAPGDPFLVAPSMPQPIAVLRGALTFLTGIRLPLAGDLALSIVSSGQIYGIGLTGSQRFELDPYALTLGMGLPNGTDLGWGDRGTAVGLLLLDLSNGSDPRFTPIVRLGGLGVTLGRKQADEPLIKAGGFTLGSAGGYISLDIGLTGAGAPRLEGAVFGAVEVRGLSLVIDTGGGDGGNAVAASLLQSDASGDTAPAVPGFDMLVGKGPQGFAVTFKGQPQIRIEINRTFGPLHIKEVSLIYNPLAGRPGELGIAFDAAVALAGISIAADDLGVFVPLDRPSDLSQWRIDLAGLAVDYTGAGFSIGGGMQKATLPDGSIDYRGALSVNIAAYGFSAIGAYARPSDAAGGYTSLFMFLAISAPIGGPPYLFVTGLAAGAGYNRRLLTPRDPAGVPGFPLVQAMDGGSGGDPMDQLERIGADIPPARGALWVAAGIRFSTFELLKTTALLTVAVDRGFEITLMGLMRLQLPPVDAAAIVSLELALSAKYSTVDQILSIRAELTENSWLISRDCKITGGFAFVVWFRKPEALLTVGGYSRNFNPPAHYPIVPRVGFNWSVGGGITIKGGAFFAITHSALMVGGSLEASYKVGPVRAWFIAELDIVVSWDPFRYQAYAFVQVGVEIKLQACLFGKCIAAPPLRVTIGAELSLEGPPLHGFVVVDAGIATIRIPFGRKEVQPYLTWDQLRAKYVGEGTAASISAGALAGDGNADGSAAKPWLLASEFRLRVETKMPATALSVNGSAKSAGTAPTRVDLVPAGTAHGPVSNTLKIVIARADGSGGWQNLSAAEIDRLTLTPVSGKFPGAVWDGAAGSTDAVGNRVADTSRPMLSALAMAEFASAPEVVENTGQLGDFPLAGLVEDAPVRAMAFRGKAAAMPPPPQPPAPGPAPLGALVPIPALRLAAADPLVLADAPMLAEPLLVTMVRPRSLAMAEPVAAPMPLAAASIWSMAPAASHTLKLAGAATRVIGLSATGKILADTSADDTVMLGAGIQSLVLAAPTESETLGWEAADDLVQAGPATFIAPGAVLTTPQPFAPRRSLGRVARGRSAFAAARLTRAMDGITTRIALSSAAALPTSLVIRLDRQTEGASPAAVAVAVTGAVTGTRRSASRDGGIEIVLAITADPAAEAIEVQVTTGPDWRLAGVVALGGKVESVASRLRRNDVLRFSATPSLAAAANLLTLPVLEIS
jgi:hypothetical protein